MANRGPEDGVLDETIAKLRAIGAVSCLEQTLGVGKLLLERFFEGDFQRWHDRRRNKDTSLRQLARRPDCPYRRSKLSSAIGVYEIWSEVPCVRTCGHIQCSHLASVVGLPRTEQEELLRRTESERWTVKRLRREVAQRRRLAGDLRGRKRPEEARVQVLLREVTAAVEHVSTLVEQNHQLKPSERRQVLECADEMQRSIQSMRRTIGTVRKAPAGSLPASAFKDAN